MKAFRVTGSFLMGRDWSPFTLETADESPEDAREHVLSLLGSRHRVDRQHVRVDTVEEIDADEVTDDVVAKRLETAGA